jgi:hypothetical protein
MVLRGEKHDQQVIPQREEQKRGIERSETQQPPSAKGDKEMGEVAQDQVHAGGRATFSNFTLAHSSVNTAHDAAGRDRFFT